AETSTTTSLSQAGRLIGNMLQLAAQDGNRPAIQGTTPLAASPNTPAPQLAAAMRSAVSLSGLFYESHVAQWATGSRAMSELLREPAVKRLTAGATAAAGTSETGAAGSAKAMPANGLPIAA